MAFQQSYSEPEYIKSVDRAKHPFYHPNIDAKLVPEVEIHEFRAKHLEG
jgi:hypothetical protein